MSDKTKTKTKSKPEADPVEEMAGQVLDYLGEERVARLRPQIGTEAVFRDELTLACLAARRREMGDRQRVVWAAIHLLRRGGSKARPSDLQAWAEARDGDRRNA